MDDCGNRWSVPTLDRDTATATATSCQPAEPAAASSISLMPPTKCRSDRPVSRVSADRAPHPSSLTTRGGDPPPSRRVRIAHTTVDVKLAACLCPDHWVATDLPRSLWDERRGFFVADNVAVPIRGGTDDSGMIQILGLLKMT